MPMTAAASSFPGSSHQQMPSMSGGGQLGRFARLRQGHGRTQSIVSRLSSSSSCPPRSPSNSAPGGRASLCRVTDS